jgi:hypothetical protein
MVKGLMMLYDLFKVFDTVNTEIFLKTLTVIGILGDDLHWFKRYFSDRMM